MYNLYTNRLREKGIHSCNKDLDHKLSKYKYNGGKVGYHYSKSVTFFYKRNCGCDIKTKHVTQCMINVLSTFIYG